MKKLLTVILMLSSFIVYTGCGNDGDPGLDGTDGQDGRSSFATVVPPNNSVVPPLVSIGLDFINQVEVISVVSSLDTLPNTPDFVMAGNPDGAGLINNNDGTFDWICNAENHNAVMAITLSASLQPLAGRYIANGDAVNNTRLCSATLADQSQGFSTPTFLTAGESSQNSMSYAVDPTSTTLNGDVTPLPALGQWSAENIVPLTTAAYSGQTNIIIGDDDFLRNGHLAIYSSTAGEGNISDVDAFNGVLRPVGATNSTNTMLETDISLGDVVNVEFAEIPGDITTLTGEQIDAMAFDLGAISFGRVEDIDFRKGSVNNNREIYFNVTGQALTGRTIQGRVYRLTLDDTPSPRTGTLEVIVDGDDPSQVALQIQSPDNITVTENYAYFAEDPNGFAAAAFGHDARVYQYNLNSGDVKIVMELQHGRNDPSGLGAFFGGADGRAGSWEYGALIDVTDVLGLTNTTCFLLNIQMHTWDRDVGFSTQGVAGGSATEDEGGLVIAIKGLPR